MLEVARRCCKSLHTLKPLNPLNPKPFSSLSFQLQCTHQEQEAPVVVKHGDRIQALSLSNHPNPEISCFYQKGFSQITQEPTGKALHGLCIKGLACLGVFANNTLVNMYSRFGRIGVARCVFDNMSERNEASWNSMVSGFVRAGSYEEAFGFFNEMMGLGVMPSGFAVASLMSAFDRSGCMFGEGQQVHGYVVKVGLLSDVFVGTSLLHFYGTYGLASGAREIFEEMPDKNVVSYTALMVAYSDYGDPVEVMGIYRSMRCAGVSCNANTLASVISSCGTLENELLGRQVLGHVTKFGLDTSVSVANALISMFSSLAMLQEVHYVFDRMDERDTISWNAVISALVQNGFSEESLRCFHQMRHVHDEINTTTLSVLLSGCSYVDGLKWGSGIHGLVVKLGLDSSVFVSNTLIDMYSGAGKCEDAELVFQGMAEKDSVSWNSMMGSYAQNGKSIDALKVFSKIFCLKYANFVTFTSALAACADAEFVDEGKALHALVIVTSISENSIVGNALVTMYAKSGMMDEAEKVFKMMPEWDLVTWNALIGGYADDRQSGEAIKTFNMMRREALLANYITITNLLGACLAPDDLLQFGMPIHAYVILTGFESDNYVENSLITMYAKCGDLNSSKNIFNKLAFKNDVTWSALMAANTRNGHVEEALKLLVEMRRAGAATGQFSFSECLSATAKLAILEEGQQIHGLTIKLGFDKYPFVVNATMDMYGKSGEVADVLRIIAPTTERSRLSWNILISTFARHGLFDKARETFHEMLTLGVKPDHVTFVSLLSACSHGGLVNEGLVYYESMIQYGVPAGVEHCVCIIDLLGRSGRLTEALNFIQTMPAPPIDLVWRSLLGSCKIHGNKELATKAAENLLKLDPSDDSAYVLYSNVCATTGKWEDVENVRQRMESNKIKKKPAYSWVKLKDELSSFGMGDQSHPQSALIYSKLEEIKKMIKEAGYVADTSYALHDTDEEQKEHNLWNHSERLALAFGLINTPPGSTIKVFKNLRVCGDCHSVYKFVSGLMDRKIVLRDPFRFHHFTGGRCSCSDYW